MSMSTGSSERPSRTRRRCSPHTGDHLSGGCRVGRPFLCGGRGANGVGALAAVAARSGVRTELNRWLLNGVGSVDAISAGVLLALPCGCARRLLIVEHARAASVAARSSFPSSPPSPPGPRHTSRDPACRDRWAGVAAAHGDRDVGGVDGVGVQDLRRSVAMLLPPSAKA